MTESVVCSACGFASEPGRKFCGDCGSALPAICEGCGATTAPSMRFCGACGRPLLEPPATREPIVAPPIAERRLVTVMFADLVGFTALSDGRDPEAVRDLLTRYFDVARATVDAYGGTVEKFIGDAVMAVWGAPTAHEDDAERAVRAALELVEAVGGIGRELEVDLQLRAGVLTGEVAATVGAQGQGIVAGDVVNTASRLQAVAPPGAVLVGETTQRASARGVAYERVAAAVLEGKQAPVAAYRALRVLARMHGIGRSDQLEAPFVGRRPELRVLKSMGASTALDRQARLVSIVGQAGVGKSRLAWEYEKYLDGLAEDVYWHQARSPSYGGGTTFSALAEMVRARIAVTDADDPATAADKLGATLRDLVPDGAERAWLNDALRRLIGLEESGAEQYGREELFAAWRTFFERLADRGMTILVFEDLHWADDGLIDFVDHLLTWSRERPIYLITLARPELLERRPQWGAGRRNFTSLVLDPLDAASMRELLAGLLPGLPEPIVAGVLDRAEGVPLYAVETVRMLLAEGVVTADGAATASLTDLAKLSIPPTLHALIASRLDGLAAPDRALLVAASVIGRTFSTDALAAVSGQDGDEVEARLRALARSDLVAPDRVPRSSADRHSFVQSMVREVAYSTLAKRERRRFHLAAARYFESRDDEPTGGVLADHYLAAYRAQPSGPEGAAVAAQARVALRAAGERASSLGAHTAALAFFEQALEVTTDPGEQRQLHASAAGAAMEAGLNEAPIRHSERALELARDTGDGPTILAALVQHALAHDQASQCDRGAAILEAARTEYRALEATPDFVRASAELARAYMLLGRYEDALAVVDATLPTAERLELVHETIELVVTRAPVLVNLHRLREAIMALEGAIAMAAAHGMVGTELRARANLGYTAAGDDPRLAFRASAEGLDLARRLGHGAVAQYLLGNACELAAHMGDWEWVIAAVETGLPPADDDFMSRLAEIVVHAYRGVDVRQDIQAIREQLGGLTEIQLPALTDEIDAYVAEARGEDARARDLAERAIRTDAARGSRTLALWARCAARIGDEGSVREALDRLAPVQGRSAVAARAEAGAALAALTGRRTEALAAYLDAAARYREMGLEFDAAMAELGLISSLGVSSPEAQQAAEDAVAVFTRLGAIALLDRVDEARHARPLRREVAEGRPAGVASGA